MEREILVDRLSAIQEEIDAEAAKSQNQETARQILAQSSSSSDES